MVGIYDDPQFGKIEARGYSNFNPPQTLPTPSINAKLDRIELQLELDFYYFGTSTETNQHLKVYEVRDTLSSTRGYYNNSVVRTSLDEGKPPLGEVDFTITPQLFDEGLILNAKADTTKHTTFGVRIQLDTTTFGHNLLQDLKSSQDIFADVVTLGGKYKGFAFVMTQGDKIFGINPKFKSPLRSTDTKISLYYTEGGKQTKVDFLLYSAGNTNFSTLSADRSMTAMSGIKGFKEFIPSNNRFYVQSGTALVTKLDLGNFYKYVDTLDNVVFNSAEIVVKNNSTQKSPVNVLLRVLDSVNHFRNALLDTLVSSAVKGVIDPYLARMPSALALSQIASSTTINVRADLGPKFAVVGDDHQIGKIFITEFCQQIYRYKHDKRKIKALAIMSDQIEFANSVNVLNLDPSLSLRLYYSKPVIKIR